MYSNGTPTLPAHSSSINYTYENYPEDLQKDFMYRKYINYVPNGGLGTNNIVIRLQHKTTQVITKFNFADELLSISTPNIGTNYPKGTINLNTGDRTTEGYLASGEDPNVILLIPDDIGTHTASYKPVKINGASGAAGATTTGRFRADIVTKDIINGNTLTRKVDAPFLIKPGYKTTLNIVQGRCGANINGVNKFFMCHNLGADYNVNPDPTNLTPTDQAKLHGAKYMWGAREESISMINDQPNGTGMILSNYDISENEWGTANSSNNPCPSGYRIPTTDELQALITPSQNTSTYIGKWSNALGDVTNFGAFRTFTSTNNTNYSITLPAAGWREKDAFSGSSKSMERGFKGYYWASNKNLIAAFMRLSFDDKPSSQSVNTIILATAYVNALSVRCIAN